MAGTSLVRARRLVGSGRRAPSPAVETALDPALTLPFLLDTTASAIEIYDHFDHTDDVMHFVNWFILVSGIATTFAVNTTARQSPSWLLWTAAAGIGAGATIAGEAAEYASSARITRLPRQH